MPTQHYVAIVSARSGGAKRFTSDAHPSRLLALRAALDWLADHPGRDRVPAISTCHAAPDGRTAHSNIQWHGADDIARARAIVRTAA